MNSPEQIFSEYKAAHSFKASIGSRGLYEQTKINERFFVGDQWYGAKCGNERPLVRHNLIKRIGDYKMSALLSSEAQIVYSAEGIPNTVKLNKKTAELKNRLALGENATPDTAEEEIALVISALNDYGRVSAERLKFQTVCEQALRDAYISGTGVVYTYWDADAETGLYADAGRTTAIKGDIACEVLDIENVYFAEPKVEDVQSQPYIIIANSLTLEQARREAIRYGSSAINLENIKPDNAAYSDRVTVLTKLYKSWNEDGSEYRIFAKTVTETAVIRDEWDIGVRMYPLCIFAWEKRKRCIYGDSEVTYLIPNQIAVNRMITSGVWSAMTMGMPTLLVNGDVVSGEITNDPGQIIKVYGSSEETANALKYICPPDYSGSYSSLVEPLIENTLAQSGANSAALGDVDPQNTSAILALRNAAMMPLKLLQNRFYAFLEEISRVWAEFWITQYGSRQLKIQDENGIWYMEFDGEKYKDIILSSRVDVTAADTFDSEMSVKVLDNLLEKGAITVPQYLRRLPRGIIPEIEELIRAVKEVNYDS